MPRTTFEEFIRHTLKQGFGKSDIEFTDAGPTGITFKIRMEHHQYLVSIDNGLWAYARLDEKEELANMLWESKTFWEYVRPKLGKSSKELLIWEGVVRIPPQAWVNGGGVKFLAIIDEELHIYKTKILEALLNNPSLIDGILVSEKFQE